MSNAKTEYEMTEEELAEIMESCKPVPYMIIGSVMPRSPQENANEAWGRLGKKRGFDSDTAQPISGKGNRFFSAVPTNKELKDDRT